MLVALDAAKAFDTVWTDGLIYKMFENDYPVFIVKTIQTYLDKRHFYIKIKNIQKGPYTAQAGVPQGSVLAPHLYTIMTHDMPMGQNGIQTALYADDTCIFKTSYSAEIALRRLDIHINRTVVPYLDNNKIKINPSKTESILMTKRKTDFIKSKLKIQGEIIPIKNKLKYLGITLDRGLTFGSHIIDRISKTTGAIKLLYPLLHRRSGLTTNNKLLLYRQVLRPILTYGGPAFCSMANTNFSKMQRTQNKCLRLVLECDRYARIDEMHEQASIEPIKEHILRLANKFYKHCLPSTLKADIMQTHDRDGTARKHGCLHQSLQIYKRDVE